MPIQVRSLEDVERLLKKVVEKVDKALTEADLNTSRAIEYNARVVTIMSAHAGIPQVMDSLREIARIGETLYVIRVVPQLTEYLPTAPRAVTQTVQETRETLCRTVGMSLDLTKPCPAEELTEAIAAFTESLRERVGLSMRVDEIAELIPQGVKRAVGKELLLINRALVSLSEAYVTARDAYVITSSIDTSMLPRDMEREALKRIRTVRDAYTMLPVTISMLRATLRSMLEAYVKVALRLGVTSKNLLNIILSLGE